MTRRLTSPQPIDKQNDCTHNLLVTYPLPTTNPSARRPLLLASPVAASLLDAESSIEERTASR